MTVGGWLLFACGAALLLGGALGFAAMLECGKKGFVIAKLVGAVLTVVLLVFMLWWFGNTASGKRAFKSQESNFNDGIERSVKVYDVEGEVIAEYHGKFDVKYDESRILFDDENGKRHIIYYPTGTVVIDEE